MEPFQLLCKSISNGQITARKNIPGVEPKARRTVWGDIATRFSEPAACLASFLALESAEVVAGIKPANLFSMPNRAYACGKNPYQLWKQWGRSIVETSRLEAFELLDRSDSALLLLYCPDALENLLATPAVQAILARAGHEKYMGLARMLDRLASRLAAGSFPHEIGVFLGYPLKDVAGFMGLASIPFTCQGPWKIYGNPAASLRLAENFRCCRSQMAASLKNCTSPYEYLASSSSYSAPFFTTSIENNNQNHPNGAAA